MLDTFQTALYERLQAFELDDPTHEFGFTAAQPPRQTDDSFDISGLNLEQIKRTVILLDINREGN